MHQEPPNIPHTQRRERTCTFFFTGREKKQKQKKKNSSLSTKLISKNIATVWAREREYLTKLNLGRRLKAHKAQTNFKFQIINNIQMISHIFRKWLVQMNEYSKCVRKWNQNKKISCMEKRKDKQKNTHTHTKKGGGAGGGGECWLKYNGHV